MATISIERIEQQMREAREARMRGDLDAQGDHIFGTPPRTIASLLQKMVFTFSGKIGRKYAEVQVVPEELVDLPPNCLARKLRFALTRPDCVQTVVVAFPTPVKVDREGITVETKGRDVRGRRCIQQIIHFNPFSPFRGDKAARRQMKDFGARRIK